MDNIIESLELELEQAQSNNIHLNYALEALKDDLADLREELDTADELHYDEVKDVDSVILWLLCVIAFMAMWIYTS